MVDINSKEYLDLLDGNDAAKIFAIKYAQYIHAVDDFIDRDQPCDKERPHRDLNSQLLDITNMARDVFSCRFYQENIGVLYQIDVLVATQYRDSLKWEHATEEWKRQASRFLSLCGELMIFTILGLVRGTCVLQENSMKFRDSIWSNQIKDLDKPTETHSADGLTEVGRSIARYMNGDK